VDTGFVVFISSELQAISQVEEESNSPHLGEKFHMVFITY